MNYTQYTDSYNERRYGKPWIAVVTFDSKSKANFEFGTWVGEHGYKGLLEIDAQAGDVIATGQKDNRNPKNSAPDYFILNDNGELDSVGKLTAYEHYKNNVDIMPTLDELLEKKTELIKQLEFVEIMISKQCHQ
jgi:hypothetical protein